MTDIDEGGPVMLERRNPGTQRLPGLEAFDPDPVRAIYDRLPPPRADEVICDFLEDLAYRLDQIQVALANEDLDELQRPIKRLSFVADKLGLREMHICAGHVQTCLAQEDGVALRATVARLERGFDDAISEVWNFRDPA